MAWAPIGQPDLDDDVEEEKWDWHQLANNPMLDVEEVPRWMLDLREEMQDIQPIFFNPMMLLRAEEDDDEEVDDDMPLLVPLLVDNPEEMQPHPEWHYQDYQSFCFPHAAVAA